MVCYWSKGVGQPGWETGFRPALGQSFGLFFAVFFSSALENQRDSSGISCLSFSRTMMWKDRTFDHKIFNSHLHPLAPFPNPLPPTEFMPQPDPLHWPRGREGTPAVWGCLVPLLAAPSLSLLNSCFSFKTPWLCCHF